MQERGEKESSIISTIDIRVIPQSRQALCREGKEPPTHRTELEMGRNDQLPAAGGLPPTQR